MPKVSQVPIPKVPPSRPAVGHGLEPVWDLREVPSDYLVAELVRRGECPKLQPGTPARKKVVQEAVIDVCGNEIKPSDPDYPEAVKLQRQADVLEKKCLKEIAKSLSLFG